MTRAPDVVHIEIGPQEAGSRIDRFLGNRFYPTYSRSFLTGLIEQGKILVDGRTVRPAYRVAVGDRIEVRLEPHTESSPEPEDIPLEIVYEDDELLVVHKPAGMLCHPGAGRKTGTLVNALVHHDPAIARVGVVFRPGIVHRLDAHTSGVMVVAKTNFVRQALVEQFKAKRVRKEYRALVVGRMPFDSDYIDLPIGPDPKRPGRMAVVAEGGKPSSTYYEVIERFRTASHVRAMPFTGRTHQIRVHLAHVGYPVMADPLYGRRHSQAWFERRRRAIEEGTDGPVIERHALHAHRLTLVHPVLEREMTFEAPLPQDMARVLEWYRTHEALAEEEA